MRSADGASDDGPMRMGSHGSCDPVEMAETRMRRMGQGGAAMGRTPRQSRWGRSEQARGIGLALGLALGRSGEAAGHPSLGDLRC
jgi:hypothetical protein